MTPPLPTRLPETGNHPTGDRGRKDRALVAQGEAARSGGVRGPQGMSDRLLEAVGLVQEVHSISLPLLGGPSAVADQRQGGHGKRVGAEMDGSGRRSVPASLQIGTCASGCVPCCSTTRTSEGAEAARPSIVAPARVSHSAQSKASGPSARAEGDPVHSFPNLLAHLATVTRNTCGAAPARGRGRSRSSPDPRPLQHKVFQLLGVALSCSQ